MPPDETTPDEVPTARRPTGSATGADGGPEPAPAPPPEGGGPGALRVGGRVVDPSTGPGRAAPNQPPRSVPARGGGYDRVGGSRLTGTGAVLLAVVILVIASPPSTVDHELMAIIWAALIAVLIVGVAVPLALIRRVEVDVQSPRDATVGEPVAVTVMLRGRSAGLEVRALDPTGRWQRAQAPGRGTVEHLADRRGVFGAMRVEVRVTAPLGILAAHRVHAVLLPRTVEVAPRAIPVTWLPSPAPITDGAVDRSMAAATGDLVRSVRPYVSGDAPHLVHWPSSARTGELVVRELERPAPLGQAVVLDLSDLGADTERAASYALGACRAVLGSGGQLLVATCEADGPVADQVRTLLDAGRRLARAVPGPPGRVPPGWPVVEIGR